jgi:two-component SAPR family response regulator
MNSKLLIFGSKNFNNSINEVKEYLNFSLIFFDFTAKSYLIDSSISAIIVDSQALDLVNESAINKIHNKPILLLETLMNNKRCNYNARILLPASIDDLTIKINNIITAFKFLNNSSLKINKYILDKNEKKLIKENNYISITEREVQLIELLFNKKKPLTKNYILKKIWNYSDNVDTHTVETHIYRLRKKIYNKFNDEKFILNLDKGYII